MNHQDSRPSGTPGAPEGPDAQAAQLAQQVADLQARLDRAERAATFARAAASAPCIDAQAVADALEALSQRTGSNDPAELLRHLRQQRPGLFRTPGPGTHASAATLPGSPPPPPGHTGQDPALVVLRERARQGDRASLLLYLRARRSKE